jgi:hypothetical protein
MATKRTALQRSRKGQVTPGILEKYLALRELYALNLPLDDERMMAWGEHDMLAYALHQHFGLKPWHMPDKFKEVAEMLAKTAGVTRLHPEGCYELT